MEARSNLTSVRITGALGVLGCLIGFAEFPLWYVSEPMPQFSETAAFSEFVARHSTLYLVRTLMDLFIFSLLLVFFGGFRHLITVTRPAYEWLATTFFGVALVYVAVTLVSDALVGSVALDTVGGKADPSAVRALNEGTLLLFGAVAEVLVATMSIIAATLVLRTQALPRWTGWLSLFTGIWNLAFVPAMFFGTDFVKFYSAAGDGPAGAAPMMFVIWILASSICMLAKRTAPHGTSARQVAFTDVPA